MGTRHPLYNEMTRLGISVSEIARSLQKSPSTVQKQLTGVNPLKEYVKAAIEAAIHGRTGGGDVTNYGGSYPFPSEAELTPRRTARACLPTWEPPQETMAATLDGYLRSVEMVRILLKLYDLSDIEDLRSRIVEQRQKVATIEDSSGDVDILQGEYGTIFIDHKTPDAGPTEEK
jgi:hypothetical protein